MNSKYEIIEKNDGGRRRTIRFKQYEYCEPIDSSGWIIKKNGCGQLSWLVLGSKKIQYPYQKR